LTDQGLAESYIVQVKDVFWKRAEVVESALTLLTQKCTGHGQILTDDVVSEGVLNQGQSVESDLGDELNSLRVSSVIDTSLKNTTSVSVSSHFDTVSGNSVVDELQRRMKAQAISISAYIQASPAHPPGYLRGSIGSNTFE
jgi:hypothetical protein